MVNRMIVLLVVLASQAAWARDYFTPSVAVAPNGTCAIVANASAADSGGVVLVLRDSAGHAAPACVVNRSLRGTGANAAVCADASGRFLIAWEQWRSPSSSIYISRSAADGKVFGAPDCVVDDTLINAQTPRVAAGSDGRFVVVWLDYRSGHPAVYAQRYRNDGRKQGRNIRIAESASLLQTPSVCMDEKNTIGIVWQETVSDSFRIAFRACAWSARAGSRVLLDDGRGQAYASTPDIASARAGEFVAVWKDYRTGESNIYAQRVSSRGERRGQNIPINDDTARAWQRLPRVAASHASLIVVWEDYRNDPANQTGDIYAQHLTLQGRARGANMRVNDSLEPTIQRFPAVSMNAAGWYAIVWVDGRSGGSTIYAREGRVGNQWSGGENAIVP